MNAYDAADGTVVIDLCVYDKMFASDLLGPFGDGFARLERWIAQPADAARQHHGHRRDAARVPAAPRLADRQAVPLRLLRAARRRRPTWPTFKYDLQTGERWTFDHGAGRGGGEPVFVSRRPNAPPRTTAG